MKPVYFLSDAHLGSLAIDHGRMHERRLVNFLDNIKHKACAIYLLGDMFDFWYEYKYVVPKGYTRFLGKLSELTDLGIEVHYFTGNHDIWTYGYLERECGVIVHRSTSVIEIYGRTFFLAHGDGLGDPKNSFKIIRSIFHSHICQRLFSALHPRWGMAFGQQWAKYSRIKHALGGEPPYMGEEKEHLVLYTKDYLRLHPNIDFFIYGHRHIELDLKLTRNSRIIILGDWITQFTYAVYDGEHFFLEEYVEGESQP